MAAQVFEGHNFVLEVGNLPPKEKDFLKQKITGFGGKIDFGLSKSKVSYYLQTFVKDLIFTKNEIDILRSNNWNTMGKANIQTLQCTKIFNSCS